MDLTFDADQEAFRAEARTWLMTHVPAGPLPSLGSTKGIEAHRRWESELYAARWSAVSWPSEFGGRNASIMEWLIFEEEYDRAQAPERVGQEGIFVVAPTVFEYGNHAQKERFLSPMASGDKIWCHAWSEPETGRNVTEIRSYAVPNRGGDGWLLTGQKTWARRGLFADWCFAVFRTDRAARDQQGLTYFLIAMNSPGVTVRPIPQMDGNVALAEISFDNVEVPDGQVLGGEGSGWSVALSTAGSENGLSLRNPDRYTEAAARLIELFDQRGSPPMATDAVARAYIDAEAYKLHSYWTASKVARGRPAGPEVTCNHIFSSETDMAIHRTALALLGPEAELREAGVPPRWLDGYLSALSGPDYAGMSALQRKIITERLLGLVGP